jgi:hypothetical protein
LSVGWDSHACTDNALTVPESLVALHYSKGIILWFIYLMIYDL